MDNAKLVDRQVKRTVVGARVNRKVALRGKTNGEAGGVRSGDRGKSSKNGGTGEDGEAIDRDDEGANVFASNVPDVGCRGTGDDSRKVATLAYVACGDVKSQSGMGAANGLGHGIESRKGIVGDREIGRGQ